MSLRWGSYNQSSSGNRGRAGIEVTVDSETSSEIRFRIRTYFGSRYSAYGNGSYSTPAGSGSFSYSHPLTLSSLPSSTSSSNVTLANTRYATYSKNYSGARTITFTGSISGIAAIPGTMSASNTGRVPARAISRPNAPTSVSVQRHSDTAHTVSWSHSSSSARPVDRFRVQRRVFDRNGWGNWVTRATVGSGTRSYRDTTGLNRAYQWRVRAENNAGSATSSATSTVWTTPWRPSSVSARPVSAGIRVSFTDNVQYGSHDHQIQHQADGGSWSTVATVPGALSHHWTTRTWTHSGPDLTVTHRYRVRSRTTSGPLRTSDWQYTNVVELAAPPAAPTGLGPSTVWDASEDRVLTWRHVPTDGSGQERFQVRHRLQGGSWTTESAVASESEQWTLPGGTYQAGDVIEWQVRTMGVHPEWGPWSASNFQQPTSRPTVAINEPVDGEEIDTSSVLVTWGYSGPDQDDGDEGEVSGQAAWRLTVLRGSNVVTEESGSDDRDEFLVRGLSDDATYTIRVEVRSGEGLWSAEPDEVTISVSYLPPAPPQIGVAWDRDLGAAVVDVQTAPPHEPYEYVNRVTNPRGRPVDTDAEADPLAARQALLDALAAYTDAPVQWSATEPGDTSVVWVDPGSGVARWWSAGVGGSVDDVVTRNLAINPQVTDLTGCSTNSSQAELTHTGSAARWTWTGGPGSVRVGGMATTTVGEVFTLLMRMRANRTLTARLRVGGGDAQEFSEIATTWGWHSVTAESTSTASSQTGAVNALDEGDWIEVDRALITSGEYDGPYFDGDTPGHRTDNIIYRYAWEDEPHASPSTETALGRGWHDIVDPDVVAAGQEYADAITALAPVGWDGPGLWWSAEHDAVYVPQGTEATVPTEALPETVTLVLLDAETGETTQHWDRTDATIPADTVGRYLRAAIVEGGMFTGPYFDGDYPRGPGQDGSLATYTWDGEPHDSATTATITSLETESVQLWRAIDDGPWLLIADEVPPDTAISDPIPAIGDRRVNHYRATSVSGIGSAMHSDEHQLVVPTHGPGGNHGWVYLNGGQDFSDVVKVRANATRSGSQGLAKGVRRYAGNPMAQERSGTAEHRTWSISVNAREALYEEGASRPEDIIALQVSGGVVCYRDPKGARWFASMGQVDDSYQGITGEVSWSMEEVDQPEGLASEARDQSHGDEDGDGGEVEPE